MFESKMVNDTNQHFCGGWIFTGLDLSNHALLNRVLKGEKPMGIFIELEKEALNQYTPMIDEGKFNHKICRISVTGAYYLAVAPKARLNDLFDLKALEKDYHDNGIYIDVDPVSEKELKDYFEDWDAGDDDSEIEFWETRLILGYPNENTISLYKGGIR